jgi:hypothetical protein
MGHSSEHDSVECHSAECPGTHPQFNYFFLKNRRGQHQQAISRKQSELVAK